MRGHESRGTYLQYICYQYATDINSSEKITMHKIQNLLYLLFFHVSYAETDKCTE